MLSKKEGKHLGESRLPQKSHEKYLSKIFDDPNLVRDKRFFQYFKDNKNYV